MNEIEKKNSDFGKAGKSSVQQNDEYYENGKTLKSEKCIIIFAKISTEMGK